MTPESSLVGKVSAADVHQAQASARTHQEALKQAEGEWRWLRTLLLGARLSHRLRTLAARVEGKPILAFIAATTGFGVAALVLVLCGLGLRGTLAGAGVGFLLAGAAAVALLYCP